MPINVLFVHSGDSLRGSEAALLTLLRGLDPREVAPHLFTSNAGLAERAMDNGIETTVHPLPQIMADGKDVQLNFWGWAKAVRRMSSLIEKNDIRLVYCNGGSTCQVGYYAGKLRSTPVISHLHSPYNRRYILLYRLHRADKVIFVSDAIRKLIVGKQEFHGEWQVVHNGVDTARFAPAAERDGGSRERLSIPRDAVVFGQISAMIALKGIDVLLRAFQIVKRRFPNSRLVLVGSGADEKEFRALSDRLGLGSSVVWAGNQNDTRPFYRDVLDVHVLASRSDAFPLAVLEAAACGLPNIGSNVGGVPECVLDGETGLLFERENHETLAEKMSEMILNPGLRKKFGQAARKAAVERFSMETYCGNIQRIILDRAKGAAMAAPPIGEPVRNGLR